MNPVMDLPHVHDWWSIHAKDLQSICQLGVNFFFDSLGVVHLPLLGCAAWRGKAKLSLNIPVISEDIDARARLQIILINFRRGCRK